MTPPGRALPPGGDEAKACPPQLGPGDAARWQLRQRRRALWKQRHAIRRPLRRRLSWAFGAAIAGSLGVGTAIVWAGHKLGLWMPTPLVLVGVSALLLWAAAGRIARRLTRPLEELARVAREIGDGRMDARVRLRHGDGGEAAALAGAIDELATQIDAQLRAGRELLAGVSHELRTPLGHLAILLERAEDAADPGPALAEMRRELAAMERLVGELLASSRLELVELEAQPVDVVALCAEALERRGLPAELLVVAPTLTADVAARSVHGDPTLLARALANALDNAERHGEGTVALELAPGALAAGRPALEIAISDAGPGVGPDEREAVFAAFSGSGRASSLGLGLALVRRICVAHGGDAAFVAPTNASRPAPDGPANEPPGARLRLRLPMGSG